MWLHLVGSTERLNSEQAAVWAKTRPVGSSKSLLEAKLSLMNSADFKRSLSWYFCLHLPTITMMVRVPVSAGTSKHYELEVRARSELVEQSND